MLRGEGRRRGITEEGAGDQAFVGPGEVQLFDQGLQVFQGQAGGQPGGFRGIGAGDIELHVGQALGQRRVDVLLGQLQQ